MPWLGELSEVFDAGVAEASENRLRFWGETALGSL